MAKRPYWFKIVRMPILKKKTKKECLFSDDYLKALGAFKKVLLQRYVEFETLIIELTLKCIS